MTGFAVLIYHSAIPATDIDDINMSKNSKNHHPRPHRGQGQ